MGRVILTHTPSPSQHGMLQTPTWQELLSSIRACSTAGHQHNTLERRLNLIQHPKFKPIQAEPARLNDSGHSTTESMWPPV